MSLKKKLRATRGVTLTEMLVAVAVLSLVTLTVSVGISAGLRTYRSSTTISRTQVLMSTLSRAVADELRFAQNIRSADDALSTYTSPSYGEGASVTTEEGRLCVSSDALAAPAYLVGSGTYGEFTAGIDIRYDKSEGCFEVTLSVFESGVTEAVQSRVFAVRALNP